MQPINSWIEIPPQADFPLYNIPFGILRRPDGSFRAATAIGRQVVDLLALHELGHLHIAGLDRQMLANAVLNPLIQAGKPLAQALRAALIQLFDVSNTVTSLREKTAAFLVPVEKAEMVLPLDIRNYTDFYSSKEHATNVGSMFRDPDKALLPNWKHLPVGYHGRASSIVVDKTPIRRPWGQILPKDAAHPVFAPSQALDFELEMAFVVGTSNPLGTPVTVARAEEHIWGLMLFNDWSARDIQQWEYVPLGPFLGKSFASTVSPWVITLDALEPFRCDSPMQDPQVLPHLRTEGSRTFDIALEAWIQPQGSTPTRICQSNFNYLYWNMSQQLAHHTSNGCNLQVGDLCASGTISGTEPGSYGSMLELAWRGTKPLRLPDGQSRTFLEDGDTLSLQAYCQKDGLRLGFGTASGTVLPALNQPA